ncbi:MAG: hypothetical protein Q9184_007456 [Pyrenodesmia sp. 2 TL-2023]
MAKEKPSADPDEKRLKKEKKEKKRSETDGVHKSSKSSKSDKKEKKDKSSKKDKTPKESNAVIEVPDTNGSAERENAADEMQMTTQLLNTLEEEKPGSVVIKEQDGDKDVKVKVRGGTGGLLGALVPFANPLADEKVGKKVLKGVRRAAKHKTLKRGVKEVQKALRKSPATSTTSSNLPLATVILAADISPMDVISHLPVLCEDHSIPYVFVTSRAELGAASSTKRPTSVVMITRDLPRGKAGKGKKDKDEDKDGGEEKENDWEETYADLVKVVLKAERDVRI